MRYRYLVNDGFNAWWKATRKIGDDVPTPLGEIVTSSAHAGDAQHYMTVWLKNIERIVRASGISTPEFDYLDVGCGKGVSTLYARETFQFRSVSGFDFDENLVAIAERNRKNSCVVGKDRVRFFTDDAATIRLPVQRWFCFLFNPFGAAVLRKFLSNNIDTLRSTGSVIGYANSRELHVFDEFEGVGVERIEKYNLSIVRFR